MQTRSLVLALSTLLAPACSSVTADPVPEERVRIDHLVIGIADLEAGMAAFEVLTGVRPVYGGEHPHLGTHNALVGLGGATYLEIIAPRPGAALADAFGFLAELPRLTPVMWAVATDDIQRTAARLAGAGYAVSEPVAGSRKQADGSTLHWTVCGMAAPDASSYPFFIEWGPASVHPSDSSPGGCELVSFDITDPKPKAVQALVGLLGLDIGVRHGAEPSLAIGLRCPQGEVRLGR
jgi:hypothetical protein